MMKTTLQLILLVAISTLGESQHTALRGAVDVAPQEALLERVDETRTPADFDGDVEQIVDFIAAQQQLQQQEEENERMLELYVRGSRKQNHSNYNSTEEEASETETVLGGLVCLGFIGCLVCSGTAFYLIRRERDREVISEANSEVGKDGSSRVTVTSAADHEASRTHNDDFDDDRQQVWLGHLVARYDYNC